MTREEREKHLDWLYRLKSEIFVFMPKDWMIPFANALDVAIKALEQEPCEDCISRQAVLEWCGDINMDVYTNEVKEYVLSLPSVNQQPKTGRWIPIGYDGYADGNPVYDWRECSECGWEHTGDDESLTAFCPNCGVKMEVEE